MIESDYIEQIPEKVNNAKKKRKQKQRISVYREMKVGVHSTINGKGIVSRALTKNQSQTHMHNRRRIRKNEHNEYKNRCR